MNRLAPATLTASTVHRILVTAEFSKPEALKQSFAVVGILREAGYVAEVSLGVQQLDNFRWTLDVQDKPPLFVLTDRVKEGRFEVQTATEVLTLLGEKGEDKTGTA